MLRASVSFVVAVVPLCLPVASGGSDDASFRWRLPRPDDDAPLTATAPHIPPAARPFHTPVEPGPPLREIVFSFDDGPDLQGTPAVMAELDRRGLKGIFFVNGRHMVGNRPDDLARRELVRTLASHGHLVANHGFSHKNLCRMPEALIPEVDGNAEIIAHATGIRPELFRSPYGARCPGLSRALAERELISVGWDLDPQDWRNGRRDNIVDYVATHLRRLNKRAILLLHDTHPAAVRALPRILDWIDAENQRVAGVGGIPIRVRDYGFFFPGRELPPTGLGPIVSDLTASLTMLPGIALAQDRLGLR